MKKYILFLSVVILAACTSSSQPQRNIERALKAGTDNLKGYSFVDLSVSKSLTVSGCLELKIEDFSERVKNAYYNVNAENNRNFLRGTRDHSAKEKYDEIVDKYNQLKSLRDCQIVKDNIQYADIYKIKYQHKVDGESVQEQRFFIVGIDNTVLFGPFSNYSDAFEAYSKFNLNHIDGYSDLLLDE